MSGKPHAIKDIHSASFRDYYQRIVDDKIEVTIFLPGIDKNSLNVRNNPEILLVSARYRKDLREMFHCDCPIDIRIKLLKRVDPNTTSAEYKDGLLKFEFVTK